MTTELEDRGRVEVDKTEVCDGLGVVAAVVELRLAGDVLATLADDVVKVFKLVDDADPLAVLVDAEVEFKRCPGNSSSAPRRTTSLSRLT